MGREGPPRPALTHPQHTASCLALRSCALRSEGTQAARDLRHRRAGAEGAGEGWGASLPPLLRAGPRLHHSTCPLCDPCQCHQAGMGASKTPVSAGHGGARLQPELRQEDQKLQDSRSNLVKLLLKTQGGPGVLVVKCPWPSSVQKHILVPKTPPTQGHLQDFMSTKDLRMGPDLEMGVTAAVMVKMRSRGVRCRWCPKTRQTQGRGCQQHWQPGAMSLTAMQGGRPAP